MPTAEDKVLAKRWFYELELPSGRRPECYAPPSVRPIHSTRWRMVREAIERRYGPDWQGLAAVDIACHQGFYASQLARGGVGRVLAVDARAEHVADTRLLAEALGLDAINAERADVGELTARGDGPFDICLMLGLIYHLENPVAAIRTARALTRGLCLIETQVAPGLSGPLDWGHHDFVRPMKGSFAIVDETEETHAPEASTTGICLAPSTEALVWIMQRVGFDRVELIAPPADAYEQHRHGKRVMAAGFVD